MTASEAKKDCTTRMRQHGATCDKLTAKTMGFGIYVEIYGWQSSTPPAEVFAGHPKASDGGYVPAVKSNRQPNQIHPAIR